MTSNVLYTFKDYEDLIKEIHEEHLTVGYVMESNRLYVDEITFEHRVDILENKVDIMIGVFNPQYQEMVQIDKELGLKLYGDKPRTSVEEYIEKRKDLVHFIFITPNDLPYRSEVKEWIYRNGPLYEHNDKLNAYDYIRGCYATEDYLNTLWNVQVDYIVSCPWRMKYNVFCTNMVKTFGVDICYPWDIRVCSEDDILKV